MAPMAVLARGDGESERGLVGSIAEDRRTSKEAPAQRVISQFGRLRLAEPDPVQDDVLHRDP